MQCPFYLGFPLGEANVTRSELEERDSTIARLKLEKQGLRNQLFAQQEQYSGLVERRFTFLLFGRRQSRIANHRSLLRILRYAHHKPAEIIE